MLLLSAFRIKQLINQDMSKKRLNLLWTKQKNNPKAPFLLFHSSLKSAMFLKGYKSCIGSIYLKKKATND